MMEFRGAEKMKYSATFNNQNFWINVDTSDANEMKELHTKYLIDQEMIDYSLDKNEGAHFEYNKSNDTFLFIYVVPKQYKDNNHYETTPITFIIKENIFFTITNDETKYLLPKINELILNDVTISLYKLLFNVLFMLTDQFFPLIEGIDRQIKTVNGKLRTKTNKQNLLDLSDLEISNTYLFSAAKQDAVVLEQLKLHFVYSKFNEVEKEELVDTIIETRQLVEMTRLSSQVLNQLSGTYNNILNNTLNETMRILTVLSVLLTIPTIITGFFGMNMPLPLENNVLGWLIIIGISITLWFILSIILSRFMR